MLCNLIAALRDPRRTRLYKTGELGKRLTAVRAPRIGLSSNQSGSSPEDLKSARFQVRWSSLRQVRAKIADVCVVINRGTAGIHRTRGGSDGTNSSSSRE